MLKYLLIPLALTLSGCDTSRGETDGELHCSKSGQAYLLEIAVGTLTYVRRTPAADPLCEKAVNK